MACSPLRAMGSMIEPHASWVRGLARAVGVNPSAIRGEARLRGLFPTNLHPCPSVLSALIRVLFRRPGPARAGLGHGDATPKRRRQGTACRTPTCSRKQAPRAIRQAQTIPDKTHHKGFHLCQSGVIRRIAPQRTFTSGTSHQGKRSNLQPCLTPPPSAPSPRCNPSVLRDRGCAR